MGQILFGKYCPNRIGRAPWPAQPSTSAASWSMPALPAAGHGPRQLKSDLSSPAAKAADAPRVGRDGKKRRPPSKPKKPPSQSDAPPMPATSSAAWSGRGRVRFMTRRRRNGRKITARLRLGKNHLWKIYHKCLEQLAMPSAAPSASAARRWTTPRRLPLAIRRRSGQTTCIKPRRHLGPLAGTQA